MLILLAVIVKQLFITLKLQRYCCYCQTTVGPLLTNFNFDGLSDA